MTVKWTHNAESNTDVGRFDLGEAFIQFDRGMNAFAYTIRFNRASYVTGQAATAANAQERVEYNVRIW